MFSSRFRTVKELHVTVTFFKNTALTPAAVVCDNRGHTTGPQRHRHNCEARGESNSKWNFIWTFSCPLPLLDWVSPAHLVQQMAQLTRERGGWERGGDGGGEKEKEEEEEGGLKTDRQLEDLNTTACLCNNCRVKPNPLRLHKLFYSREEDEEDFLFLLVLFYARC